MPEHAVSILSCRGHYGTTFDVTKIFRRKEQLEVHICTPEPRQRCQHPVKNIMRSAPADLQQHEDYAFHFRSMAAAQAITQAADTAVHQSQVTMQGGPRQSCCVRKLAHDAGWQDLKAKVFLVCFLTIHFYLHRQRNFSSYLQVTAPHLTQRLVTLLKCFICRLWLVLQP